MTTRRALGWIGPAIVIVGAAVAAVGIWYFIHARPHAGEVIDTIAIDGGDTLVVRAEAGGPRSFLELHHGGDLIWQALIPHYAGARGRSGIAWSPTAITVRVERDGRAEVFGMMRHDSAKIGGYRLAVEHEPITTQPTGPITLTDHERSYELVGGADWHQLIAVDLGTGKGLWKVDLGPDAVTAGAVDGGDVAIDQGAHHRRFAVLTGREDPSTSFANSLQSQ